MSYTYEHKTGFDFAWAWSRGTIRGEASWTADKRGMYVTGRSGSREEPYVAYTAGADITHRNGNGAGLQNATGSSRHQVLFRTH